MSLLSDWLHDFRQVLLDPEEFYADLEDTSYMESARFVAIAGLLLGIPLGILSIGTGVADPTVSMADTVAAAIISIIILPVALIIGSFIQSLLVHLAVWLFGGGTLEKTFASVSYALGATAIWGWIPIVNLLASVYSLYLQYRGVKSLHELSQGESAVAVLWPVIASIIISFFFLAAVLAVLGISTGA